MKGIHILADFKGCNFKLLDDLPLLEQSLIESANKINATILNVFSHKFTPQGVTVVITLAESHLSIHSAPELGAASCDFFTCGSIEDPYIAFQYLESILRPQEVDIKVIERDLNTGINMKEREVN